MTQTLEQRVNAKGIDHLWLERDSAFQEMQIVAKQLASVTEEISTLDRLLFFHTTPDEAEEKRLKERASDLRAMISRTTVDIEAVWEELSSEFPAFSAARRLESVLALAVWARSEADRIAAQAACSKFLSDLLASREDRPVAVELQPQSAARELFSLARESFLVPLAALRSLLSLARGLRETTWEGARPTLLYRPLILALAGAAIEAFRQAEPETALPTELAASWQKKVGKELALPRFPQALASVYSPGGTTELFAPLTEQLVQLAGYDLCLEMVSGEISTFDRIVFWSDTPAEARKKQLLKEREELSQEISRAWVALAGQVAERRAQVWTLFASDQTLLIRDAVAAISTSAKESSRRLDCPLHNQAVAIHQVQVLQQRLKSYGLGWKRRELIEAALAAAPPEPPPLPDQSGLVPTAQVVPLVSHLLHSSGLAPLYKEVRAASAQARQHSSELQSSQSKISMWDKLNVFSDSEAERSARQSAGALSEVSQQAAYLRSNFDQQLDVALQRSHLPLLVCLLNEELLERVSDLRAVCDSKTVRRSYTDSDGDTQYRTETVYYCYLAGKVEVDEMLGRLAGSTRPLAGQSLSAMAALEVQALLDCPRAELLYALLGAGAL